MMRDAHRARSTRPRPTTRVRVIVLEGAGDHFCGGADIVARNAGDRAVRAPAASSAACRRKRTA